MQLGLLDQNKIFHYNGAQCQALYFKDLAKGNNVLI